MLILAGLGNPGPKYETTRHNIGFMIVDEIADIFRFSPWRKRFQGETADGTIAGEKVMLLKPMIFMNESGRSVGEALRFFKLEPKDLIVFHDELDLAPGRMRVKQGGGHGGHNGLRSIDRHVGKDYHRVRLGIGHPGDKDRVHGYVLNPFPKADATSWLPALIDACTREAPALVGGDHPLYMTRVSQAVFPPPPKSETKPAKPADKPASSPDDGA